MSENSKPTGRRALLKKAAGISAGVAVAGVAATQASRAAMSKASVQYQDTPKDGHQCDGCALYVPAATAGADGTCKAVDGKISPKGWCTLWSPKS